MSIRPELDPPPAHLGYLFIWQGLLLKLPQACVLFKAMGLVTETNGVQKWYIIKMMPIFVMLFVLAKRSHVFH